MAKIRRDSIRIINLSFSESVEGVLSINNINITGIDDDTNETVVFDSLPPEDQASLLSEVSIAAKRYLRFWYNPE